MRKVRGSTAVFFSSAILVAAAAIFGAVPFVETGCAPGVSLGRNRITCAANESGACGDGIDNDCDGAVDCADADCATASACSTSTSTCLATSDCPAVGGTIADVCCGGLCVDLTSDAADCGTCGTACASDSTCSRGVCVRRTSSGCATDADCPAGSICVGGACGPTPCAAGLVSCGGACIDASSDPSNCGSCGNACPPGATCARGVCTGAGACRVDADCPAGTICVGGACGPTPCGAEVCNGLDDDCDGVCDNGFACCAGTRGSCTTTCGSIGTRTCDATCAFGSCTPPAEICGNGIDDDCDGVVDNGCACPPGTTACGGACVDVLSDASNCGACGNACAVGSTCSRGTCVGSTCVPEVCNGIDDDCDGVCDNGFACCRGTTGSCTTTCGSIGTRTCDATCALGSCTPPAEICGNGIDDDCDGIIDNGCACPVGFADCDGNPTNGCEANLSTSNTNCGSCGTTCRTGTTCVRGACI